MTRVTLAPVSGASIEILDATTRDDVSIATKALSMMVTDSAGAFAFTRVGARRYVMRVSHLAFGTHLVDIVVPSAPLLLTLTPTAIELAPLEIAALSNAERSERAAGYRTGRITRTQIAQTENTNATLPDVLQRNLPGVRVRRLERLVGSPMCVELRTIRQLDARGACLAPKVYLDGVPVVDATLLWTTMDVNTVESIEVVPANEASARYGLGAQYGAILIESRRPGAVDTTRIARHEIPRTSFDWNQDPQKHRTSGVFAASFAANAAGLLLGNIAARTCLHLRQPSNDAIVSDCSLLPSFALGAASVAAPVLVSTIAARAVGKTRTSVGKMGPSVLGGTMAILPGLGMVLAGQRAGSHGQRSAGYVILLVGVPAATTAADYLFRRVR